MHNESTLDKANARVQFWNRLNSRLDRATWPVVLLVTVTSAFFTNHWWVPFAVAFGTWVALLVVACFTVAGGRRAAKAHPLYFLVLVRQEFGAVAAGLEASGGEG